MDCSIIIGLLFLTSVVSVISGMKTSFELIDANQMYLQDQDALPHMFYF